VLREKLKIIKMTLREWHLTHTHNLPSRIDSLKENITLLESKGEVEELTEEEIVGLHGLSADLFSLSWVNARISWQQARMSWLGEGDSNSKYIHALMTDRRHRNAISSILVDGDRVEGVFDVREAVFNHFEHHFKYFASNTSRVDNLHFHRLSHAEDVTPVYFILFLVEFRVLFN